MSKLVAYARVIAEDSGWELTLVAIRAAER